MMMTRMTRMMATTNNRHDRRAEIGLTGSNPIQACYGPRPRSFFVALLITSFTLSAAENIARPTLDLVS